jgi:hypothetical protein
MSNFKIVIMKKLIIIFFLLWKSAFLFSQVYLPVNPSDYGTKYNRLKANLVLHIPVYNGDTTLNTTDTSAQIRVNNGVLQYHYGSWKSAGGGGDLQTTLNLGSVLNRDNVINNKFHVLSFDGGTYKFTDSSNTTNINGILSYNGINYNDNRNSIFSGGFLYDAWNKNFFVTFRNAITNRFIDIGLDTTRGFFVGRASGDYIFRTDTSGRIFMPQLGIGTSNDSALTINNGEVRKVASVSVPNLQKVTDIDSNTTHKINAFGYDFKAKKDIITKNGSRFIYYDSAANGIFGIGNGVFHSLTTGGYSVAIGDSAMYNTTSGVGTAIGYGAMRSNVTGQQNVAIGYRALYSSDATGNTAIGSSALANNTTGSNNVAIGSAALVSSTTGSYNIGIGFNVGNNGSSGSSAVTGNYNFYAGRSAGRVNSGNNNVMLGDSSGYSLIAGDENTFVGAASNWGVNGNYTNSGRNTTIGAGAGIRNTGNYNTILGWHAAQSGLLVNHALILGDSTDFYTIKPYQINIGWRIFSDTVNRIGIIQRSPQYTLDVTGTGRFTDTTFGKTMGNGDSSIAFATTAFVKNQKYGTGSGAIPTLQQVTTSGSSSTNNITVSSGSGVSTIAPTQISVSDFSGNQSIAGNLGFIIKNSSTRTYLKRNASSSDIDLLLPNANFGSTLSTSVTVNGNTFNSDATGNVNLGSISGTGFVPYTGATQGLDLGTQTLKAGTTTTTGEQKAYRVITTNTTLTTNDQLIGANSTSGTFSITLPSVIGITGQQYTIKKIDNNSTLIGISPQAGQTIENGSGLNLNTWLQYITIIADGISNWKIIGGSSSAIGTVTSFGKTDNWGIISSVTNSTTTPVHAIGVDSATLSGKYLRRTDPIPAPIKNVQSIVSAVSFTPTSANDMGVITALAVNTSIFAPTGTLTQGQELVIRIKDNGTQFTLTWNAIYRASTDLPLPTATTAGKTMYLKFIYNADDAKEDLVAVLNNF